MEIILHRHTHGQDYTIGTMVINWGDITCSTLEDAFHEPKIKGRTRIPEGVYKIKFRKVKVL